MDVVIVTAIQDWLMSQSHYNIIIGRKSQKSVFCSRRKIGVSDLDRPR